MCCAYILLLPDEQPLSSVAGNARGQPVANHASYQRGLYHLLQCQTQVIRASFSRPLPCHISRSRRARKRTSRYIHLNPVRAGVVEKPEDYPWSSYRAFIDETDSPQWLHRDFVLGYVGSNERSACRSYRTFVSDMLSKTYEGPLKKAIGNILGDSEFIEKIAAKHLSEKGMDRNIPAIRTLKTRPRAEEIIHKVKAVLPDNEKRARQVGIYLCHRYSGSLGKDTSLQEIVEKLRRELNV